MREFLTADIEGVEGIGAVGTMFEQILFRFGQFLTGLVLVKSVASVEYSGRLNGKEQIIVVLPVEERHQTLLSLEGLVDKQVLLIVPHGITQIDILHRPAVPLKFMDDDPSEILCIDGIVTAQGGSIVVEDDGLALVLTIVVTEIFYQGR